MNKRVFKIIFSIINAFYCRHNIISHLRLLVSDDYTLYARTAVPITHLAIADKYIFFNYQGIGLGQMLFGV